MNIIEMVRCGQRLHSESIRRSYTQIHMQICTTVVDMLILHHDINWMAEDYIVSKSWLQLLDLRQDGGHLAGEVCLERK